MKDYKQSIPDIIKKHEEDNKREAIQNAETFRLIALSIIGASLIMILFYRRILL